MAKFNFFTLLDTFKKKPAASAGYTSSTTNDGSVSAVSTSTGNVSESRTPAQILAEGMINVRDIIAPSAIEVDFNTIRVGSMFYRTIFVSGYPRFVGANWLSPIINFDHSLDISMFYYPVKSKAILEDLRRKITELEATMASNREKGRISDPVVSAALEDAQALQEQLVKGVEKYFQFSFYITIPAQTIEDLNNISSKLESILGSLLLISKVSSLQMEEAFQSTVPAGLDKLLITRNMDTTSLATTFPFTSSDLTMEEGIMYGINTSNGSLVIFDRFSLENANSVVFAKSGSGKSYFVKLEALRHIVFGAEVLVIDPEEEYRDLCSAVGGNYIDFSPNSTHKINPFDLSGIAVEGENELASKLAALTTLLKLMLGGLTPAEEAVLDRALNETYRIKGITPDPETQLSKEPPVMEDLYKVLMGGDEPESRSLAERLEKFIKGSMAGIFDYQSNIKLDSKMTVFSTKNLEETLRPIAFQMILDFIWTRIKRDLRKRILIVEEAWYLLANKDSASFIYGIAKRARKYYLGLTTVSQDVDDFLTSDHGKAIVTNSSIQILLKQSPAAIDKVATTFYLSEGEKRLLLAADLGQGLFFAGPNHVGIRIIASPEEHKLITTNPEEILKLREQGLIKTPASAKSGGAGAKPVYKQFKAPVSPSSYSTMDAQGNPKPGFGPDEVQRRLDERQKAQVSTQPTQSPQMQPQQPTAATQNTEPQKTVLKANGGNTISLTKTPQNAPVSSPSTTPVSDMGVNVAASLPSDSPKPQPDPESIPTDEIMKAVMESVRADKNEKVQSPGDGMTQNPVTPSDPKPIQ
jgi:conjugal transfer ATP-binding protein TraC